jgi:hypothetical protein
VTGSGRRRQATTPLRRRLRRDVLAWGLVAGLAAGVALGLTGGGWWKALVLGLLVFAGCLVLTLLSATSGRKPPLDGPRTRPPEGPAGPSAP